MKFFNKVFLFALFSFLFFSVDLSAQSDFPSIDLKSLDGKVVNTGDISKNGKISIISFWATWCTPCKRELDAFHELYEDWSDEYDVEVIAITIDNARALAKVKPMVASKGWEFSVLSDVKQDLKRALGFQTIPQTYILDQDGKVVYRHNGYAPGDELEVEDKLAELSN